MSTRKKLLQKILSGKSDSNVRFIDLCSLLESLGFAMRVRGSHHIFRRNDIEEKVNLQKDNKNAKPYQVKQVRTIILKYDLMLKE